MCSSHYRLALFSLHDKSSFEPRAYLVLFMLYDLYLISQFLMIFFMAINLDLPRAFESVLQDLLANYSIL